PAAHIQADLADHDQGGRVVDPLDRGQVNPRDPLQGATHIKGGLVALALGLPLGWRQWGLVRAVLCEGAEMRFDLTVTLEHFLVIDGVPGQRWGRRERVLLTPLAVERCGNRLFAMLTAIVPEPGERDRIALARQDGADNGHPGHPSEVADDML